MADPFVSNLLHLWGLDALQEDFRKQEIDQESLEALDDSLIAELVPIIGRRAKFLKKFREYKLMNSTETITSETRVLHASTPLVQEMDNGGRVLLESGISEGARIIAEIRNLNEEITGICNIVDMSDTSGSFDIAETSHLNSMNPTRLPMSEGAYPEEPAGNKQDWVQVEVNPWFWESGSGSSTASLDKSPKKKRNTEEIAKNKLSYPSSMPKFTSEMRRIIESGELLLHSKQFVRECGSFLLTLNGRLTRSDYELYSRTLVERFPELQDQVGMPYASLKRRIARYLRNARYHAKWKKKKTHLATTSESCKLAPLASFSLIGSAGIPKDSPAKEICSEGDSNKNHPQTKLFLEKLLEARRKWVTTEAKGLQEILQKFPHLKIYTLFMYEFELLAIPHKPMDHFEVVIRKLEKLFGEEHGDDRQKLQLFEKLESRMYGKRPITHEPAIKVQLAGVQTDLKKGSCTSPVMRVVASEDGVLTDAYLVVDGEIITPIDKDITPYKCMHLLISSYFVFNVEYPKAYAGFLTFLECEMLSGMPKGNITFTKFMNLYNNKDNKTVS